MSMDSLVKMRVKNLKRVRMDNLIKSAEQLMDGSEFLDPNSQTSQYLFNLLMKATIMQDKEWKKLEHRMIEGAIEIREVENLIEYLKDKQPDPIESGDNYNMRDIHNKLDRMFGIR